MFYLVARLFRHLLPQLLQLVVDWSAVCQFQPRLWVGDLKKGKGEKIGCIAMFYRQLIKRRISAETG
jgi:hypothetical protein